LEVGESWRKLGSWRKVKRLGSWEKAEETWKSEESWRTLEIGDLRWRKEEEEDAESSCCVPGLWNGSPGSPLERWSGFAPSCKTCTCCHHRIAATSRAPMWFLCRRSASSIRPSCFPLPYAHIRGCWVPTSVDPRNLIALPTHSPLDMIVLILLRQSISPAAAGPHAPDPLPSLNSKPTKWGLAEANYERAQTQNKTKLEDDHKIFTQAGYKSLNDASITSSPAEARERRNLNWKSCWLFFTPVLLLLRLPLATKRHTRSSAKNQTNTQTITCCWLGGGGGGSG
jgi:hypothetical protein